MGGKAGKILPLVAMAVATYFTAGAALGAGGAAASGAGAAGAGAAGGLGTSMAAAVEIEAALTQGLVASGIGAPMSMAGLGMTAFEKASLALGAAGLVSGISGAAANAQTQRQALAIQAEEQRVKLLSDKLAITQREAEVQKNLRRTLAAQTVAFNARGIDPGSGSPFALQEGVRRGAEDDLDVLATQREISRIGGTLNYAALANRRRAVGDQLFQSVSGSLLHFGEGTLKAFKN